MKKLTKMIRRNMFKETYYEKLDKTKVVFTIGDKDQKDSFDLQIRLFSSSNPRSAQNFEIMAQRDNKEGFVSKGFLESNGLPFVQLEDFKETIYGTLMPNESYREQNFEAGTVALVRGGSTDQELS